MSSRNDHLTITPTEKRKLRSHRIRVRDIHKVDLQDLQEMLGVSKIRAMELSAMSAFQSLPSVGPRFAQDLISMGFYSLRDLKEKDGAKLTDAYEQQVGVWADPCVEDMFRLVVHYANHPDVRRNWWDFTEARKVFREKHGYPINRPTKAWYELAKYRRSDRVNAEKETTREDLGDRLKAAARYLNRHYSSKISLSALAKEAAVSPYHFLRQFKNVYEVTPLQYLTHVRLKNASRLLKKTHRPVAWVVQQCGFVNESSFIRLFRKELGTTPLQFRKDHQVSHKKP